MGNSFTKHGDMALNLVDLAKYPIENLEVGEELSATDGRKWVV